MPPITAIYIRVSTDQQETQTQDDQCYQYCSFRKQQLPSFEHPTTYQDSDVSGSLAFAKRPGGGRLLQAVQRGEVEHIIVAKLDRLGRSAEDILRVVRICETHNTVVHFTDLGGDPLSTGGAAGKMVITVMAAFAEFERNRIRERIIDRMESKRLQCNIDGSWGEVCGTIPYGWQAVETERTNARGKQISELVLDSDEQSTLQRLIKQRYGHSPTVKGKTIVTSLSERPPSYKQLANWLNAQEIPTKSRGQWSAGSVAHVLNNTYTRLLVKRNTNEKLHDQRPAFCDRAPKHSSID